MTLVRAALVRCAWMVAAGLGGCTVGPDYRRPVIATPAVYAEADAAATAPLSAEDADISAWWTRFDDPTLTRLIARALADSLTLEAAASRIRQARSQEIRVGAAAYPSISATGSALGYRSNASAGSSSTSSSGGSSGGSTLALPSRLNLYSVGFDASWEVDLFGATRRAEEGARANTEAMEWARRDGEVSLTAEIASDYFALRALQARLAVSNTALDRQNDLFVLVQARRRAGFVTLLDVDQQSTLVASTAAQMPPLDAEARVRIHALGVLLGQTPEALQEELAGGGVIPPVPAALPLGLPSELLRRRPDVRLAERRLAASSAQVGVAQASFFPKLDLLGLTSFAGMTLSHLLSSQNLMAAGVGLVSEPVFDAGRNRAAFEVAKEERVQADLAYRVAVLGALRDVEDALVRYRGEASRRESLGASVGAAQRSLSIARDQYQAGTVTFINVLQAQRALLDAQDQCIQSDALTVTDLVAVYKALGGGWSGPGTVE
jgi:NodT family efflux transporter outer membrane factor (OMF) lipoprotein